MSQIQQSSWLTGISRDAFQSERFHSHLNEVEAQRLAEFGNSHGSGAVSLYGAEESGVVHQRGCCGRGADDGNAQGLKDLSRFTRTCCVVCQPGQDVSGGKMRCITLQTEFIPVREVILRLLLLLSLPEGSWWCSHTACTFSSFNLQHSHYSLTILIAAVFLVKKVIKWNSAWANKIMGMANVLLNPFKATNWLFWKWQALNAECLNWTLPPCSAHTHPATKQKSKTTGTKTIC